MWKNKLIQKKIPDLFLLATILGLVILGVLMVYSSSHIWSEYKYGDSYFYVKRQVLFAVVGLVLMFIITYFPHTIWRRYVNYILLFCFLLLVAVLVPGIGIIRGGAQSWIGVGGFSIQPAEFMKLGLILFLAAYFAHYYRYITTFTRGFFIPILLISAAFGLIMLQPDFGTGVVLVTTCVMMVFIAGARLIYFIYLGIIGLVGFACLIISAPYRMSRIMSFLNPWDDPLGDGFQIIQSLYSLGPGKLIGTGFDQSIQKHFYLPEPQTDFIFAIIGEELGFVGASITIILFFLLCLRGIQIALNVRDPFSRYIAFGITTMISIQVIINISVVIGLIPVTGITLPFLSYGGSSLTLTLCSVGFLLNISMDSDKRNIY